MKKRAAPLFLAVLTACALACPALAAEAPSPEATPSVLYPVEVLEYTEGDRAEPRISKTYELSPMDDPALIPTGDFERSGCLYTLLDIVKEDQTETDSKYYTETVTLDSKSKDMEEIMPLLAATCEAVTEDGYTGLLTLDTASIQVEASGYATSTRNVSATRSYPNLSEADVSLVPKSIEDSGRTLTLADVQWQEAGGFYNAAATYTGTASSKYATGYTVTADYAGEVTKTTSGTVLYTAVFGLAEEQEAVTGGGPGGDHGPVHPARRGGRCRPGIPGPLPASKVQIQERVEGVQQMRLKTLCLAALILAVVCVTPASALEYTMDAPDDYLFARPTSDTTIYEHEDPNVDRSKNTALIPPGFGTPTSYLPGSGTALTPNLVPGALDGGGLVSQVGSVTYPAVDTGSGWTGTTATGWTDVTSDLYYSGGHLGTLKIPAIGLSVKVYEGTGSKTLAKGAGHFEDTSLWDGNCCIAAHNRGVNNHFGKLHTLEPGDTITWTTKLGTRTYEVVSVQKVKETDTSGTAATSDNRLTLFTCVRDQRDYRWMVQAVEA